MLRQAKVMGAAPKGEEWVMTRKPFEIKKNYHRQETVLHEKELHGKEKSELE